MTRLLIAFALGFMLAWVLFRRKPQPCPEPVTPVSEDERWQKRIDSLESFYAEEKAIDRMKKK